MRVVISRITRT